MRRFLALSRTSHGVLDLAAPAFAALLCLGDFPEWRTTLLAVLTGFAGYTAIYALNDLLGIRYDKEKFDGSKMSRGYSVEASMLRHPLAQGILTVRSAVIWMVAWFVVGLIGSYLLNPVIVLVLIAAAVLETIYCLLMKVTPFKTIVSGLVKTSGPIAAILVVDRTPSPICLILLFAWLFFWEIGGQNIPSDWNYAVEDGRTDAKTIPVRLGLGRAGVIVMTALGLSVIVSGFLPLISSARLGWLYIMASLLLGYFLLLRPGLQLYQHKEGGLAARLFDKASYYPLAHFALISVFLVAEALSGA